MANELTKRVMRTIVERCGRQGLYSPMPETNGVEGVSKHAAYERSRGNVGRPSNRPSGAHLHLSESETQTLTGLLHKESESNHKGTYSAKPQSTYNTKFAAETVPAERAPKVDLPSSGKVRLDDLVRQVKR